MNTILPNENNEDDRPRLPNGKLKVRFEVKMRKDPAKGIQKGVFIDGEMLDWEIDAQSLIEAKNMGPKFFRAAQRDIEKHYVDSVSEVVGRHVTATDIKEAIKTGWL